ncbi:MAG TPA: ABC transporter ATP-binding protein [Myxococcaceae bacterium]|nr:ABC transporter ATP-binding protein [Myxococcaceae bacterium]
MSHLIDVQDVTRVFHVGGEEVRALRGVTFGINRGEWVAIIGQSGSGKSTLMNVLGCLDTPSSGRYMLNSKDVSRMSDDELAVVRNVEIGFIFQTFQLLPRETALANVELPLVYRGMPAKERRERARAALDKVQLTPRIHHKPNELSGGQRQRVAVARALVTRPQLVLADEPTANLDSVTGQHIIDLMKELNQKEGTTFIFSTHDAKVMNHANAVWRLADGKILDRLSASEAQRAMAAGSH